MRGDSRVTLPEHARLLALRARQRRQQQRQRPPLESPESHSRAHGERWQRAGDAGDANAKSARGYDSSGAIDTYGDSGGGDGGWCDLWLIDANHT